MINEHSDAQGESEKKAVALSSVLAAVFITAFKLTIGLFTHSLGILAEAAHSALDLVAAAVTFLAVRISGKPPDEGHLFGYGKVENLSALFETFLLLVTCVWIIYEATQRLFFKSVEVEVSIWSFVVMLTSIIIDITRSRALMKAAKKHGSQALEADALHFSTDVWSSAVVIGGLILLTLGKFLEANTAVSPVVIKWLNMADAIAALGVSIIVIYVSVELGKRTIEGLLDNAPKGLEPQIRSEIEKIPGVVEIRQIRIRPSGPSTFVDMILGVSRTMSFEEAHSISVAAKAIVQRLVNRVDVVIHINPIVQSREDVIENVRSVANRFGLSAHSIRAYEENEKLFLDMHIEVPEQLTVAEAHERVSSFESGLRQEFPKAAEIVTHIEPLGEGEARAAKMVREMSTELVKERIQKLVDEVKDVKNCHSISLFREGEDLSVSFHCDVSPNLTISEAHHLTEQMERLLRKDLPELERVIIHVEPPE